MSYQLPENIRTLKPYEPIEGTYTVRLDANESFFQLKESQLTALQEELKTLHYNRYPDPLAKKLCTAFANAYGIDAGLVTAGNGSDELICLLCSAFCGAGGKLAVLEQDFSMYRIDCEIYGVPCVTLPKKADLTIDVEQTLALLKQEQVSMLIFSNPCNPTSLGLTREAVRRLVRESECLVVLDEAYMDFWNQSLLSEVAEYDNLIILRTCSKAVGLAGIRVGFAVANKTLTTALQAAKPPYNVNSLSQLYGAAVLSDRDYLAYTADTICQETRRLNDALAELSRRYPVLGTVFLSCTNFVYIKCGKAKEIFTALLERSIAIRFMGGYLRISCGSPEENALLLTKLEEILQTLA